MSFDLCLVCIQRPIATLLVAIGVLLLGVVSLQRLPIASLPAVERPTIAVYAMLPGASPDTVSTGVTQPLQRQLGIISGIVEMASYTSAGGTQITIQFEIEKDIDAAAGEVSAAINAASPNLPKDMPSPPFYRKVNPSGFSPVALAVTSEELSSSDVYGYTDSVVVQKISELAGVAEVRISGAERGAVRVQVAPRVAAAMGLSLEQIRRQLVAATRNLAKGNITVDEKSYAITVNDQLMKADDYRNVVIAYRNGSPVRVRDLATVVDGVINTKLLGWFGKQRAVLVYVFKRPDANVVEVVDGIKALVPQLERVLPPSVKLHVLYDRTVLIRAAVADAVLTVVIAIGLVVLVTAIFLRRLWATLVPVFTIPVVLAATFVATDLAGYSFDSLSLMAITISIGFIVDDSVVVIENITRVADRGGSAFEAARRGTRQIRFTIIAITCSLLGSLLPVLFMPDVVGKYFREFGVTLVVAIVASAIVSLTLTPMLASRLCGDSRSEPTRWWPRLFVGRSYSRALEFALNKPAIAVVMLALVTIGSIGLYAMLPKGLLPTQDTGIINIRTTTVANVSFGAMEILQRKVMDVVLQDPSIQGVSSWIGTDNGTPLSRGSIIASLKPLDQRKEDIREVIARLRGKLARVDGIRSFPVPSQDLQLGVQSSSARYQYSLSGTDAIDVWNWSEKLRKQIQNIPDLVDVNTDAENVGLEVGLVMDRRRAAAFGVTPLAIDNALYDAFGQRQVATIYLPSNYSRLILEVDPALQTGPSDFRNIFVQGNDNAQVPLTGLASESRRHGAVWLRHSGQFPTVTLSFDLRAGGAIGDAISAIDAAEREIRLPDDIKAEFRGEAAEANRWRAKQVMLLFGAIFTIYVVLGMLYESYAYPLTVIASLPSAFLGALLALYFTGTELSLMAMIGCILVIGISMKNSILMVDFAVVAEREERLPARLAIKRAAKLRTRPILMTTFVTILSSLPLAAGLGAGHELRQPLGIACVGGLLLSQVLTLYITPAIYTIVARIASRKSNAA